MSTHPNSLRLVSCNIAHARGLLPHQGLATTALIRRNLDRIAALLRELRPDVVALQEIDSGSIWNGNFDHVAYLRERAELPFAAFGASNDLSSARGKIRLCYGNALLSRHPILLAEAHRFGSRWLGEKGLLRAEILIGTTVQPVVCLHLHHASRRQRLAQAALLARLLETTQAPAQSERRALPPLIAGDFNCSATKAGDATAWLLEKGLPERDYIAAPAAARTYPALHPTRMLDYWLVPSCWELVEAGARRRRISDHLPVVVDLRSARNRHAGR